jgi:hypothetical protein
MKNHFRQTRLFILSVAVLSCSTQYSIAQIQGFKLSDYKNPNYVYQQLNLGFSLDSRLNAGNSQLDPNPVSYEPTFHSQSFASSINAGYSRLANNPRYQGEQYISLYQSNHLSGRNEKYFTETKNNANSFSFGLGIGSTNRYYLRPKTYLEFSPGISASLGSNSNRTKISDTLGELTSDLRTKAHSKSCLANFGLFIGRGRIEQVQDAQLAEYILSDLVKLNRAKSSLNNEDVLALAEMITKLKRTRIFDSRIRYIREITAIDSLLEIRGLRNESDAAYFTTINDNWMFAHNPIRQSGYRIYAGMQPEFSFGSNIDLSDTLAPTTGKYKTREINDWLRAPVMIGFKYEKPASMAWQHSVTAVVSWYYLLSNRTEQQILPVELDKILLVKTTGSLLKTSLGYSAGYFPNTLTWLAAGFNSSLYYQVKKTEADNAPTRTGISDLDAYFLVYLNAHYYLSEKLQLVFDVSMSSPFGMTESGNTNGTGSINY